LLRFVLLISSYVDGVFDYSIAQRRRHLVHRHWPKLYINVVALCVQCGSKKHACVGGDGGDERGRASAAAAATRHVDRPTQKKTAKLFVLRIAASDVGVGAVVAAQVPAAAAADRRRPTAATCHQKVPSIRSFVRSSLLSLRMFL
jgi:hypothetical protein